MSELTPGALSAGQVFHGRYEIVRCLKAGGMGAVYECIHLKTRKRRALKVMLPQLLADPGMRGRFELEARVTAEIESEHIVETFDAGVDETTGAPFLVMELLRGEDLASILRKRKALPAAETIALLEQAARALDKTHAAGIVHRDLKPDNLYVTTREDGSPRLKILDFGIAKVVADIGQSVQRTAMIGTPLYMSQEQILGEGTIGPGADVYAMGHIAFTLLTGTAYWADEQKVSPALYVFLGNVMAGGREPASARAARRGVVLPPAFDAWFARATAASASARFERVSVLVHELASVLGVSTARTVSMPSLDHEPREPASPLDDSTAVLTEIAPAGGVVGTEVPTISQGTTLVARSKPVRASAGRSRRLVAMVGLGAVGLLGVGLWKRAPSPPAEVATTVVVEAGSPAAVVSAPEPPPVATASAAPEPSSSGVVAVVASARSEVNLVPTSAPTQVPQPTASVDTPPVVAPPKAIPRPRPTTATPANPCTPPYVIDSAGRRAMKPECL